MAGVRLSADYGDHMTRPDPRQQAALSAAFAGAVDLSALKNRPAAGPASLDAVDSSEATAPRSQYVLDVTEEVFGEIIQASSDILVVFEMWSPRSSAGAPLSQALANLVEKGHGTWILGRVNVDANPRIAQAFGVQAVPTVVAVAQGQPVDGFSGMQDEKTLGQWVASLIQALRDKLPGIKAAEDNIPPEERVSEPERDPRLDAVDDLLQAEDYEAARESLQAILNSEPANAEVASALAQVEFLARLAGHADDAVAQADADLSDVSKQSAAADVELSQGLVEEAFARMIAAVRRAAGEERDAARDRLVTLFALYPGDDPRVRSARRSLAAALY